MARNLTTPDSLLKSQAAKKQTRALAPAPVPSGKGLPAKSRIFIVDAHAMFREVLRQLIELEPDFHVCGEACDVADALRGICESKPDLVIADISLAGASGIDLIKSIKSQAPEMPVLIVSMHDESLYAERALRAGAMGYLMKQEPARSVKEAIRKVLGGDMHLSEKMTSSVIAKFMRGAVEQVSSPIESLSDREL